MYFSHIPRYLNTNIFGIQHAHLIRIFEVHPVGMYIVGHSHVSMRMYMHEVGFGMYTYMGMCM